MDPELMQLLTRGRCFDEGEGGSDATEKTDGDNGEALDTQEDKTDDQQFEDRFNERNQDDQQDKTDDDDFDIDDEKLAKVLAKRGLTDPLDKLRVQGKSLSSLTSKHQDTKRMLDAIREELGDDYESVLARGMNKRTSDGDAPAGFNFGAAAKMPSVLETMPEPNRKAFLDSANYAVAQAFPKLIEQALPDIVATFERYLEQKEFKSGIKDFDNIKDDLASTARKYGITGQSKASLELVKRLYEEDIKNGLADRANSDDGTTKRKARGAPPPTGSDRKDKPPNDDFDTPEGRKAAYKRITGREE
jgi:hypothetical protein